MSTTLSPSVPAADDTAPASADDEKTMADVGTTSSGSADPAVAPNSDAARDPGASSTNGAHNNTSSTKPAATSATTAANAKSPSSPSSGPGGSRRKSGWKTFITKLVPCISPSSTSKAHPIDDSDTKEHKVPRDSASSTEATTAPVQGKPDADTAAATQTQPSSSPAVDPAAAATSVTAIPPATPLSLPTSSSTRPDPISTDLEPPSVPSSSAEIIVPPTPTRSLLPASETGGVTSGAVQPPGSTGREDEDESSVVGDNTEDDVDLQDGPEGTVPDEEDEDAIILRGGLGIPIVDGVERPLLPPLRPEHKGRKCLVLDLDETLLHSSFKLIPQCDYVVPVEIEWQWHNVYVIKRPGVDQFLKKMGEIFEIVVFTASLSKYADPVLDKLDVHKVVSHRLFRESCYNHKGNYVKDLSQLGRPLTETIILDNSPASYIFHPNNAVPVSSWFNDPHDTELTDLCPFLTDLEKVDDIRGVLDGGI